MSPPILLRSPPVRTRQPLLSNENTERRNRRGAGELAGGAAAECTAIVCCFPCTVMNIVVLAVFKVPAGLCKKAMHYHKRNPRPRRLKINDELLHERTSNFKGGDYSRTTMDEDQLASGMKKNGAGAGVAEDEEEFFETSESEKEMWAQFNGTGFWRSPSLTEDVTLNPNQRM